MGNYDKRGGGFKKREFGSRDDRPQMHYTTCSDCGRGCDVPFKPTKGKAVYCKDCFKKDDDSGSHRSDRSGRKSFGYSKNPTEEKLEELNKKLDKILRKLESIKPTKEHIIEKPEEKVKPAKKKAPAKKKK